MNRINFSKLATLALLTFTTPLLAHHGTAGSYDHNKQVTVKGVVKEFRWRNPHSALFLVAKNDAGQEVTYAIEMSAPASALKRGFTRNTMKPGDEVTIKMYPSFTTPSNGVSVTEAPIIVNGKEFQPIGGAE